MHGQKPIIPRSGDTLVVGIVARISGCANQKELSLEDQTDHAKQVIADMYSGHIEYIVIESKGKGEQLDRPELTEVERLLRSEKLDILICEDLGRLVRGAEASWLCGIAADHRTRVLAPNDCIDTADDHWEEDVLSACRDHVGHNAHTSKRLKHKLMNRFEKFGGAMAREIYGYIVSDEARTYGDWRKDPHAADIIQEAAKRLRATGNCSAVADWLNGGGVPVGPYCRQRQWDGKMVRRFFKNSILKGKPGRGFTKTVKHHETGKRVSAKNPSGPRFREFPELAHLSADEFDALNAELDIRNAAVGRKPIEGRDALLGRPRKRTVFPGQHARCWYCGRQYVWGGNGIIGNLMCTGARNWNCWNSISIDGAVIRDKVVEAITTRLYDLGGLDAQFRDLVNYAREESSGGLSERLSKLRRDEDHFAKEWDNLKASIKTHGPQAILQELLAELEARRKELERERRQVEAVQMRPLAIPESTLQLREMLEKEFRLLSSESSEFGDLLRLLVPEFHVYLVRLCDGGHPLPRAKLQLNLVGSIEDFSRVPGIRELMTQDLTIDLFEPPQREQIRLAAVQLAQQGLSQRQIAQRLPGKPTQPAVANALALDAKMQALGLTSPYILLLEPPADYPKLRRTKNQRYDFRPLDNFQRPTI